MRVQRDYRAEADAIGTELQPPTYELSSMPIGLLTLHLMVEAREALDLCEACGVETPPYPRQPASLPTARSRLAIVPQEHPHEDRTPMAAHRA